MTEPPIYTGGCRCGRVSLRAQGRPLVTMACHCTGCQRMTAGPYSLSALYAPDAFAVSGDAPVAGGLQNGVRHLVCGHCASWLFTHLPGSDLVALRPSMLDAARDFPPFIETWTSEKLPFAISGAPHAFPGFPDPARFPQLMADYRRWDDGGAR